MEPALEPEIPLDLSQVDVAPREPTAAPVPDPTPAASPTTAGKSVPIPEELRLQVEAFKRQVVKEEAATPSRLPGKPPPTRRPPPAQTKPEIPSAAETEASAAPKTRLGDASQLPDQVQDRLPPRRLTVHVFAEVPARRFVILNGQRLREGERTPDGLLLKEVRPDGIILDYEGHGFFMSRAVKGDS